MSKIPSELLYFHTHEWVNIEDDDIATIGITDHAQEALGDVVFVELPAVETTLTVDDEAGVLESVKAASNIYTPLSGTIISVNTTLTDTPEMLNTDPYKEGWLLKMKLSNPRELKKLMSADAYAEYLASEP